MLNYIKGETDGCHVYQSGTKMGGFVLASASPRRIELLSSLKLDFDVFPSMTDETLEPGLGPVRMVEELARRKAAAVADSLRDRVVLGADTLVCIEGAVLGKPEGAEDAARMLRLLAGREHEVYTGICVICRQDGIEVSGFESTKVRFAPMSDEEVRKYVDSGEPMDKAGAYAIQGLGSIFITGITGDYFNIVGLPLRLASVLLRKAGISIL